MEVMAVAAVIDRPPSRWDSRCRSCDPSISSVEQLDPDSLSGRPPSRRNPNHSAKPDQSRRNESLLSRRALVSKSPSGSHQRRLDLATIHGSESQVNSYPANERKIWEVERGRIRNAILPMPPGKSLAAGDSILFALAYSPVGQETCYVKGGDSVCVLLTDVTDVGAIDPATGKALFRLSWKPPGQGEPPDPTAKSDVKSRGSYWKG